MLITGGDMDADVVFGKPAYVILHPEACFNSKRQARRTVRLYGRYRGRVQFVIVDLDHRPFPAQKEVKKKHFPGIPHVVGLDTPGSALCNRSGELDDAVISNLLDEALR
jgi:hypothetical protein